MVVVRTVDTAGTVVGSVDTVEIAGIAVVEDTVPLAHSLFVVVQWMLKLGGHIRHRN